MSNMLDKALADLDTQLGIEPEANAETAPETGGTVEPEPAEPEVTEQQQPRDEQGRFAKQDEAPAEEKPDEEPEQELILGKFKNHDELQKAYEQLDSEFGRRNQEWGADRAARQELETRLGELERRLDQPPRQQITRDLIDEDPRTATLLAYEQNDAVALQAAFESWKEEDPATAGAWAAYMRSKAEIDEINRTWEERYAALEQRVQPLAQGAQTNDFANAWMQARTDFPDLDKHADAILEQAKNSPEDLSVLQSGTVEDMTRVIEKLGKVAAFEAAQQASTLVNQAASQAAQDSADQTAAEKREAFVASGSRRNDPEPVDEGEQWLRDNFDPAAARFMARDEQ